LAVAANKSYMYEYEEVTEEEGMAFAKQHNAIFQSTSAKDNSNGSVDLLFKNIGKKFLNPNSDNKDDSKKKGSKLSNQNQGEKKKGGCC
jgi:hypothetical protein